MKDWDKDSPFDGGEWPIVPAFVQPRENLRVWLIAGICASILVILAAVVVFTMRGGA